MVVGAFPAAKLGALLLKQISKPIANAVKDQAKTSPVFRKYVCLPPAKLYNWCEEKSKMWILNLGKPVSVPVYNEKMAIELGANLLGEGIIFVIAAGIVITEYSRSARKESAKEDAKIREMEDLKMALKELFIQTEEQAAYIRELRRKFGDLDTKLRQKSSSNNTTSNTNSYVGNDEKVPRNLRPIIEENSDLLLNICLTQNSEEWSNVLLCTVSEKFCNYSLIEKKQGILDRALNHLYVNVFKFEICNYA